MLVDYYWTEDGEPERCDAVYIPAAEKKLECYHMECIIHKGEHYYQLTGEDGEIMNLCDTCYGNCFPVHFDRYLEGKKMSATTYCRIIDYLLKFVEPPRIDVNEKGIVVAFPHENSRMQFPFIEQGASVRDVLGERTMDDYYYVDIIDYLLNHLPDFRCRLEGESLIIENELGQTFSITHTTAKKDTYKG